MRKYAGFMMLTLLLLIVPALANAWTLTVKVAGGNANNSVTVAYPTSTSLATTATKTIKSGTAYLYPTKAGVSAVIAGTPAITLDGSNVNVDARLLAITSGNHVLQVVYPADGATSLTLTQAAVGGTIYAQNRNNTWSTSGVSGLPANTTVNLAIAADNNYAIAGYKVVGNETLVPVPGTGKVRSFTLTASGQTILPVFNIDAKISASLFAPTNAVAGDEVTLSVAASTNDDGLEYRFSTNGGSSFSVWDDVASFKFEAAEVPTVVLAQVRTAHSGTFVFETPKVSIAVANAQSAANSGCVSCHSAQPVRVHGYSNLANSCVDCHSDAPHSATVQVPAPHYGGNAFLKAQYVSTASLPISCADCHGEPGTTTANQVIVMQFADSAHGDPAGEAWIHYDWRSANRSSCARCHTGTAFVAKLGNENDSSNVFQSGDVLKPGEALACSACHSDAGTGALRDAAQQFTINMRNGATVTYDVAGASTLCARCHSGRETGESIKADTDVTGIRGFIDSHYQPAAGTLYNMAGYEYAGQSYDSLGSHKLLGATSQGPCVTCHMPGKNHALGAVNCGTCHEGATAPVVNAANLKTSYDAALNDLKLALQAKGIHYGPVHPFFYTAPYVAGGVNTPFTNWASIYGADHWKDTMGAAFNYNLLWSEKGAYAHNNAYAMKLIADSIDFLNDGTIGGL